MELTSGVNKFLNDLINDESIYLVLIYGSNVTGRAHELSDLDVFVCGAIGECYHCAKVIDNQELEINFVNISYIDSKIEKSVEDNNSYFESVLRNNIVLKDSHSLIKELINDLEITKRLSKKRKREMPSQNKYLLSEFYNGLSQDSDLYDYFNFLDQIRITVSYIHNYSTLNVGKVYDMYSDSKRAIKDYCLVMPKNEFIRHFDLAVRYPLNDSDMKWLMNSIKFEPCSILGDLGFFSRVDSQRSKSILIHMDKMVNKSIRFLIENNPYKDYVYYVVINHLYRFYNEIYGSVTEEFINMFDSAKIENDTVLRIEYLKHLFSLLEGKYAFDYKNYTLFFN